MGYALTLSLALHIGAAQVFIVAGGVRIGEKNSHEFLMQDISLTPSISTPVKTATAPPDQHPAMPSTTPKETRTTDEPAQDLATEQPPKKAADRCPPLWDWG